MNRMKYCFLQVSDNLLNPDDPENPADVYFKAIWNHLGGEGYFKPEHYWEIPTWIAELSNCFDSRDHELMLHHITGEPPTLPEADIYFASVLDCNKEIIARIVRANPNKIFYLGGYIGDQEFCKLFWELSNSIWFDNIEQAVVFKGTEYKYGTNYQLFKGMKCIPRLTLSNGCTNHCRFCTVPDEIVETDWRDIAQQIESMKDLDFELIYINDKTFGQCHNYSQLDMMYKSIAAWNPKFRGFTVQTTCRQVSNWALDNISLQDLHIVNVEIGVESYNQSILEKYRKPQSIRTIDNALHLLRNMGVNIIPNIIIGLPGETINTYCNTLQWVKNNMHKFLMLNVTNFVPYEGSDVSDIVETQPEDLNQTVCYRSYHTFAETQAAMYFTTLLFDYGMQIIKATKERSK